MLPSKNPGPSNPRPRRWSPDPKSWPTGPLLVFGALGYLGVFQNQAPLHKPQSAMILMRGTQKGPMSFESPHILGYQWCIPGPLKEPRIMAQYPKIESIGSIGSTILALLELQVHYPPPPNNKTSPLLHIGTILGDLMLGGWGGLVLGGRDYNMKHMPKTITTIPNRETIYTPYLDTLDPYFGPFGSPGTLLPWSLGVSFHRKL